MNKRLLLLFAIILMGSVATVNAKFIYVPLYIIDTQPDVKVVKRLPAAPLFITQDDHRLILPEIEDSITFKVLKGDQLVYLTVCRHNQTTVFLPVTFYGDYEVRLCAETYYYYGYITLGKQMVEDDPTDSSAITDSDDITLLGSNTSQQALLEYILGLKVVEYNMPYSNKKTEKGYIYLNEEDRESYIKQCELKKADQSNQRRFGLRPENLSEEFPSLVKYYENGSVGINYLELIPVLICCIQELKYQLDSRTETFVDIMSRASSAAAVREVRAAIGNTLLTVAPSSVSESAHVRYLLADDVTNAYILVTDMGGRTMTKVPVSPSETTASIDSGTLGEGIYLCTLVANGQNIGTKRLVKTK